VIAAAFPQWPATKETVAVYADALSDVDYSEARHAVRDLICTEDRWPTIARIRRQVAGRLGILAPSSAEAWGEVSSQASTSGRSSSPSFTSPVVAEAVKTVGWWNICQSANLETMRAQFMRIYEDSQKRHDVEVLLTPGRISLDGPRNSVSIGEVVAITK
jgi:hypothetical protein